MEHLLFNFEDLSLCLQANVGNPVTICQRILGETEMGYKLC